MGFNVSKVNKMNSYCDKQPIVVRKSIVIRDILPMNLLKLEGRLKLSLRK
jgi:hypothetical protein